MTFQSDSAKYNKPVKIISWPNFLEGHQILSPEIWGRSLTDWLKKCSNGYILFILYTLIQLYKMGNAPNILHPRFKEWEESHSHFIFFCKLSKTTLDFISELMNLNYSFNIPSKVTLKASIMVTSSHFHDGASLKILPTHFKVFFRDLFYCHRQALRNLKETSFNIVGILLLITFPILPTFTRFLGRIIRKFWGACTLKHFSHSCYIFRIITHLLMDKRFP